MTDSTSTPAGWYADPDQPGHERYWDGSQWTEHSQPIPAEGAAPAAPGTAPSAPSGEWAPGPPTGAPAPPPNVAPIPPWSGGPSGPGYMPPAAPPSGGGGNKTALIVAIIVVVALVAVGAIIALAGGGDDDDADTASDSGSSQTQDTGDSGEPTDPNPDDEFVPPSSPPSGDDEALNALVDDCYGGDMGACDDLFLQAEVGSDYEDYGNTCGGRMPDPRGRYCDGTVEDPILP